MATHYFSAAFSLRRDEIERVVLGAFSLTPYSTIHKLSARRPPRNKITAYQLLEESRVTAPHGSFLWTRRNVTNNRSNSHNLKKFYLFAPERSLFIWNTYDSRAHNMYMYIYSSRYVCSMWALLLLLRLLLLLCFPFVCFFFFFFSFFSLLLFFHLARIVNQFSFLLLFACVCMYWEMFSTFFSSVEFSTDCENRTSTWKKYWKSHTHTESRNIN